ncbi:hypothetical protein FOTG_02941 [Fusarium oxysporum f. sp. vasinfectum 25433]|uniref:Uncharacterized protein n=1 Tax=Fusarium oxysporum f. sp. vasinfectum 25433 TaxID=1089449 RepID=X0M3F4_FUSOX|nr:hypothetical protein FOTG_02941 [Fusarium oxysporum f. sp. vasinfectum 25433]
MSVVKTRSIGQPARLLHVHLTGTGKAKETKANQIEIQITAKAPMTSYYLQLWHN